MRRLAYILMAFSFIVVSTACSDDAHQEHSDSGRLDGGHDVSDSREVSDAPKTDAVDASPDVTDGTDSDTSVECTPGESWCESSTVRGKCSATSGEPYSYECNANEVCQGGECVEGEPCEPEAILGCADEQSLTVCNEIGNDTTVQSCPSDTPECINGACTGVCEPNEVLGCIGEHTLSVCNDIGNATESETCPTEMPECFEGACVAQICTPGERQCQGNQIVECNDRGIEEVAIEQCAEGCASAACQFPDYTNCFAAVGCEFYAVEMPNHPAGCWFDGDCYNNARCPLSTCPNATCENGYCRFPLREQTAFGIAVTNPADYPLSVTVTDSTGSTIQETIAAGSAKLVSLPPQVVHDSMRSDRSFRIETDGPATVVQLNPERGKLANEMPMYTGDASTLLATHALGMSYLVPSWAETGHNVPSHLTLIGTQDATSVRITPTTALAGGTNVPPVAANATTTLMINQGEVIQYKLDMSSTPPADLTGTKVQSDKPVGVFSANDGLQIPAGTGSSDHIEAQVPPVSRWGDTYIVAKFQSARVTGSTHEPDIYRVMASQDNTTISTQPAVAGVHGAQLDRGEFIEFEYRDDFELSANYSVLLSQFMVGWGHPQRLGTGDFGDPAMLLPTPNNQFRARYVFSVPSGYAENHISVRAPTGTNLFLDDQPINIAPQAITGTPWSVWRVPVEAGTHRIRGSHPFGLDVYGYDAAVSYAYPGGADFR